MIKAEDICYLLSADLEDEEGRYLPHRLAGKQRRWDVGFAPNCIFGLFV